VYGVVVRTRHPGDLCLLGGDGRYGVRMDAPGDEDVCALAEQARGSGHGAAVVAVGGADQCDGLCTRVVGSTLGQGAVRRPGSAQRFEGRQTEAGRLVLDEDSADRQLGCQ
jgi:hypothetical protein